MQPLYMLWFGSHPKPKPLIQMKKYIRLLILFTLLLPRNTLADPSLTIYNQKFGLIREMLRFDLKAGINRASFSNATAFLEPDSVILRDPAGKAKFHIVEQNYRADTISPGLLLHLNEGKEIEFLVKSDHKVDRIVKGKIIRSGYVPANRSAASHYGNRYYQIQTRGKVEPLIEVDGKLRFSLPGEPLFPELAEDTILKPTLHWQIRSAQAASFDAELSYVTGGLGWEADYNAVASEEGDSVDLSGWVTIENYTGKAFPDAEIQLIAR